VPSESKTSGSKGGREASALGVFEKVGAWLRIWTPPKGVEVPPVPRWRLVLGALLATVVLVPAGLLVGGAIDTGKSTGARERGRREAARVAAERHRLAIDQRPHSGRAVARTRAAMVHDLERAINGDARRRVRQGRLGGPVLRTFCEHSEIAAEARLAAVLARYECTVVTAENRSVKGYPFVTGYVFVATIHFRQRLLVWCKTNPRPGEGARGEAIAVKLPRSCAGPLRDLF